MTDSLRQYSDEENERLARNLLRLTEGLYNGDFASETLGPDLLCLFHRRLFENVRSHAGLPRSAANGGTEYLTFGPNRSMHRNDVGPRLADVFDKAQTSFRSFCASTQDPNYEELGIHLAVWLHSEVLRIHPFEDGNGRSSRLVMNWTLIGLGLRPFRIEVPKEEYHNCLNHYFRSGQISTLIDLALGLYFRS